MSTYVDNIELQTFTCGKCGVTWAMPVTFVTALRSSGKTFYCPNGDARVFRESTEDRLRRDLAAKETLLQSARTEAAQVTRQLDNAKKAHKRMRTRVMNGVCPCCNRSFQNLRNHMQTQHPEFGKSRTLRVVREAFGMTQGDVAGEAGVTTPQVSLFERGYSVTQYASNALDRWLERQGEP